MSPLAKIAIIIGVAPLVLLIIFGSAIEYIGPPSETTQWSKLSESSQNTINEIVPAQEGERFLYYYSLGLFDFESDGNIITNKRVISYHQEEGEMYISESSYGEISSISATYGDGFMNDSEIWIHHEDPDYDFLLYFSEEKKLGRKIAKYIEKRIAEEVSTKVDE